MKKNVFLKNVILKNVILIMLIASFMLFYACKPKNQVSEPSQPDELTDVFFEYEEEPVLTILTAGHTLRVNTGFYVITGEDTEDEKTRTRWAASMALGESVVAGESRRMTFDGTVYNFTAIKRQDNSEGFALATHIAAGGTLAVVTEERASLFRSPRTVDVSNVILSRRTVVVYYPETEVDGFVEVRGYDSVRRANVEQNNRFLRLNTLSTRYDDIQASILLQTALPLTDSEKTRRDILLDLAMVDYPNSVFFSEIFEIVNPAIDVVSIPDNTENEQITNPVEQ